MSFKPNRAYNSPELGAVFNNVASMFSPDPQDLSALADAGLKRQKRDQTAQMYEYATDPNFNKDVFDRRAVVLGNSTLPYYTVDQNNATEIQKTLLGPVGQDETRFVPKSIADQYALPPMQFGNVSADPGEQITLPDGRVIAGTPKPMSETEVKGGWLQDLLDSGLLTGQDVATQYKSGTNVEEVLDASGKPVYASRDAAIAMQPAPKTPLVNIGPNGEQFGNPGEGLVWARNPDNSVKLDERGAPIAIPYKGGKVYEEQLRRDEAAASGEVKDSAKSNVVLQNLDRALAAINTNPTFTTGLGAQATGWIGGSPARALEAVLDPIRANIGFDQLQDMRDASPTGGALGQVTVRELELLQSVLGNIDPEAGPQVIDDIKRLKNIVLDTVHGVGNGPPRERLSFPSQWDEYAAPEGGETAETYATNPQTGERLVLRNGAWVPVGGGR